MESRVGASAATAPRPDTAPRPVTAPRKLEERKSDPKPMLQGPDTAPRPVTAPRKLEERKSDPKPMLLGPDTALLDDNYILDALTASFQATEIDGAKVPAKAALLAEVRLMELSPSDKMDIDQHAWSVCSMSHMLNVETVLYMREYCSDVFSGIDKSVAYEMTKLLCAEMLPFHPVSPKTTRVDSGEMQSRRKVIQSIHRMMMKSPNAQPLHENLKNILRRILERCKKGRKTGVNGVLPVHFIGVGQNLPESAIIYNEFLELIKLFFELAFFLFLPEIMAMVHRGVKQLGVSFKQGPLRNLNILQIDLPHMMAFGLMYFCSNFTAGWLVSLEYKKRERMFILSGIFMLLVSCKNIVAPNLTFDEFYELARGLLPDIGRPEFLSLMLAVQLFSNNSTFFGTSVHDRPPSPVMKTDDSNAVVSIGVDTDLLTATFDEVLTEQKNAEVTSWEVFWLTLCFTSDVWLIDFILLKFGRVFSKLAVFGNIARYFGTWGHRPHNMEWLDFQTMLATGGMSPITLPNIPDHITLESRKITEYFIHFFKSACIQTVLRVSAGDSYQDGIGAFLTFDNADAEPHWVSMVFFPMVALVAAHYEKYNVKDDETTEIVTELDRTLKKNTNAAVVKRMMLNFLGAKVTGSQMMMIAVNISALACAGISAYDVLTKTEAIGVLMSAIHFWIIYLFDRTLALIIQSLERTGQFQTSLKLLDSLRSVGASLALFMTHYQTAYSQNTAYLKLVDATKAVTVGPAMTNDVLALMSDKVKEGAVILGERSVMMFAKPVFQGVSGFLGLLHSTHAFVWSISLVSVYGTPAIVGDGTVISEVKLSNDTVCDFKIPSDLLQAQCLPLARDAVDALADDGNSIVELLAANDFKKFFTGWYWYSETHCDAPFFTFSQASDMPFFEEYITTLQVQKTATALFAKKMTARPVLPDPLVIQAGIIPKFIVANMDNMGGSLSHRSNPSISIYMLLQDKFQKKLGSKIDDFKTLCFNNIMSNYKDTSAVFVRKYMDKNISFYPTLEDFGSITIQIKTYLTQDSMKTVEKIYLTYDIFIDLMEKSKLSAPFNAMYGKFYRYGDTDATIRLKETDSLNEALRVLGLEEGANDKERRTRLFQAGVATFDMIVEEFHSLYKFVTDDRDGRLGGRPTASSTQLVFDAFFEYALRRFREIRSAEDLSWVQEYMNMTIYNGGVAEDADENALDFSKYMVQTTIASADIGRDIARFNEILTYTESKALPRETKRKIMALEETARLNEESNVASKSYEIQLRELRINMTDARGAVRTAAQNLEGRNKDRDDASEKLDYLTKQKDKKDDIRDANEDLARKRVYVRTFQDRYDTALTTKNDLFAAHEIFLGAEETGEETRKKKRVIFHSTLLDGWTALRSVMDGILSKILEEGVNTPTYDPNEGSTEVVLDPDFDAETTGVQVAHAFLQFDAMKVQFKGPGWMSMNPRTIPLFQKLFAALPMAATSKFLKLFEMHTKLGYRYLFQSTTDAALAEFNDRLKLELEDFIVDGLLQTRNRMILSDGDIEIMKTSLEVHTSNFWREYIEFNDTLKNSGRYVETHADQGLNMLAVSLEAIFTDLFATSPTDSTVKDEARSWAGSESSYRDRDMPLTDDLRKSFYADFATPDWVTRVDLASKGLDDLATGIMVALREKGFIEKRFYHELLKQDDLHPDSNDQPFPEVRKPKRTDLNAVRVMCASLFPRSVDENLSGFTLPIDDTEWIESLIRSVGKLDIMLQSHKIATQFSNVSVVFDINEEGKVVSSYIESDLDTLNSTLYNDAKEVIKVSRWYNSPPFGEFLQVICVAQQFFTYRERLEILSRHRDENNKVAAVLEKSEAAFGQCFLRAKQYYLATCSLPNFGTRNSGYLFFKNENAERLREEYSIGDVASMTSSDESLQYDGMKKPSRAAGDKPLNLLDAIPSAYGKIVIAPVTDFSRDKFIKAIYHRFIGDIAQNSLDLVTVNNAENPAFIEYGVHGLSPMGWDPRFYFYRPKKEKMIMATGIREHYSLLSSCAESIDEFREINVLQFDKSQHQSDDSNKSQSFESKVFEILQAYQRSPPKLGGMAIVVEPNIELICISGVYRTIHNSGRINTDNSKWVLLVLEMERINEYIERLSGQDARPDADEQYLHTAFLNKVATRLAAECDYNCDTIDCALKEAVSNAYAKNYKEQIDFFDFDLSQVKAMYGAIIFGVRHAGFPFEDWDASCDCVAYTTNDYQWVRLPVIRPGHILVSDKKERTFSEIHDPIREIQLLCKVPSNGGKNPLSIFRQKQRFYQVMKGKYYNNKSIEKAWHIVEILNNAEVGKITARALENGGDFAAARVEIATKVLKDTWLRNKSAGFVRFAYGVFLATILFGNDSTASATPGYDTILEVFLSFLPIVIPQLQVSTRKRFVWNPEYNFKKEVYTTDENVFQQAARRQMTESSMAVMHDFFRPDWIPEQAKANAATCRNSFQNFVYLTVNRNVPTKA